MILQCENDFDFCDFFEPCGYGSCSNNDGSFTCICENGFVQGEGYKQCQSCETGFELNLGTCQDIDECENFDCEKGVCQNNIGSKQTCICDEGYHNLWGDKSAICG